MTNQTAPVEEAEPSFNYYESGTWRMPGWYKKIAELSPVEKWMVFVFFPQLPLLEYVQATSGCFGSASVEQLFKICATCVCALSLWQAITDVKSLINNIPRYIKSPAQRLVAGIFAFSLYLVAITCLEAAAAFFRIYALQKIVSSLWWQIVFKDEDTTMWYLMNSGGYFAPYNAALYFLDYVNFPFTYLGSNALYRMFCSFHFLNLAHMSATNLAIIFLRSCGLPALRIYEDDELEVFETYNEGGLGPVLETKSCRGLAGDLRVKPSLQLSYFVSDEAVNPTMSLSSAIQRDVFRRFTAWPRVFNTPCFVSRFGCLASALVLGYFLVMEISGLDSTRANCLTSLKLALSLPGVFHAMREVTLGVGRRGYLNVES